ncbi:hypothetical protein Q644_25360 [Brucella intermedia 229E]|uniref:Uncharacterized protein n=1 Tax=Brucella intermedia 229E TaxID=1337887 RepID=U4VD27_9HYPH|nr:hypothetical protein Q644_25360 [Brucella intermedia 229E]
MDVGDHLFRRLFDTPPAGMDVLQEFQIFRRMHGRNRAKAVILRTDDLAACGLCTGEQTFDTLRLFGVRLRRAAGKKGFRVVTLLLDCVKGFHDCSLI